MLTTDFENLCGARPRMERETDEFVELPVDAGVRAEMDDAKNRRDRVCPRWTNGSLARRAASVLDELLAGLERLVARARRALKTLAFRRA